MRPFDPQRPLHVVLRSSRAKGEWSLLRHRDRIERLLDRQAHKWGIRIHRFANVGNHLHLLVSLGAPSARVGRPRLGETKFAQARARFSSFLRQFAGAVAFEITGASKSRPVGRFWDGLAFTRVVSWGREFESVMCYLVKNLFEAAGLWNRKRNPEWELGWGS